MFASFDGIEIPNIASVDTTFEEVGDSDRTAGGFLRQDMTAVKESGESPQPHHLGESFPAHKSLPYLQGAEGDFWIYGEPAPVRAKLKVDNYPLSQFASRGDWQKNGVTLNITITGGVTVV